MVALELYLVQIPEEYAALGAKADKDVEEVREELK